MVNVTTRFSVGPDEVRDFAWQYAGQELVWAIEKKFEVKHHDAKRTDEGALQFQIDLSRIRLQGMNQTQFILLDDHTEIAAATERFPPVQVT